MTKNVVVMPTLNRPEMLALALEKIDKAEKVHPTEVAICIDTCSSETLNDVEYARDTYLPTAQIFRAYEHIPALSGCWNILNALKQGFKTGADHIFLVEEDCMVTPDFFKWHLWTQKYHPYLFATCGRRRKEYPTAHYTNPGSCFSRDHLSLVVTHICKEFFEDRAGYLNARFAPMDDASDLDDGLIRRVIRSVNGEVGYPLRPVVAHQGFRYYGRLTQYMVDANAPIATRVSQLRAMLATLKSTDRYTRDFEPLEVE